MTNLEHWRRAEDILAHVEAIGEDPEIAPEAVKIYGLSVYLQMAQVHATFGATPDP